MLLNTLRSYHIRLLPLPFFRNIPRYKQYIYNQTQFIYFTATLLLLSAGTASGWGSPSLIKLQEEDSPIPITLDESSWIISLMEIGVLISAIPSAWIMDKYVYTYCHQTATEHQATSAYIKTTISPFQIWSKESSYLRCYTHLSVLDNHSHSRGRSTSLRSANFLRFNVWPLLYRSADLPRRDSFRQNTRISYHNTDHHDENRCSPRLLHWPLRIVPIATLSQSYYTGMLPRNHLLVTRNAILFVGPKSEKRSSEVSGTVEGS